VHRAKLEDGTVVAVKVQKPYIRHQLPWDLLAFRVVLAAFEFFFEIPLKWSCDYTESRLREEVDFLLEADNSERAAKDLKHFGDSVYIPKVLRDLSSSRILSCEWIEGTSLAEVDKLAAEGYSFEAIMDTVISAFSFQIFSGGFVHADPHPGNIIIRRNPRNNRSVQVCILDHGLYMEESEKFRVEYCAFWKALFTMDFSTLERICESWGIDDVNMFASASLQRPYNPKKALHLNEKISAEDLYSMQVNAKEKVKKFLKETEKVPLELIFLGRTLNLLRGNNKMLGSPVNRINIMASYAARGLGTTSLKYADTKSLILGTMRSTFQLLLFEFELFLISVGFYLNKFLQKLVEYWTRKRSGGFEELLEKNMVGQLERDFGIKINTDAFTG
jgi:aarF domain-containing kinase